MDEFKARLWVMAAGIGGGFITMTRKQQQLTTGERMTYLISALLVALFVTPWACEYFGIVSPKAVSGLAFFMGAFWQTVVIKGGEVFKGWKAPGAKND